MSAQYEVCEIIANPVPMSIQSYMMPITYWFLYFRATRNGEANQPAIVDSGSTGQVTPHELQLMAQGSVAFGEDADRRVAVEALASRLQEAGWEYYDQGKYWYSGRFRKEVA